MKSNSQGRTRSLARSILLATCLVPGLLTLLLPTTSSAELVAHWPLDTDASDATGNGYDGAVVGGTVNFGQPGANGFTGTAASFPDSGHIDVPYALALNPGTQAPDGSGSFTVALWVNSSDNAGFNSPFTAREDNGTSVNGPIIYNNPTGVWSFWAGNNGPPGAWNGLDTTVTVPLDTWQHVAITYDSATLTRKMFVDGVEAISANIGVSANVLRDIHIGSGQDDGLNFYWNGRIDDVGFWDEALSETEIQSVMDNGISSGAADPKLIVNNNLVLPLDGGAQTFDIDVANGGETQDLTISAAMFSGPSAVNFSVQTIPAAPIPPGGMGTIVIAFDPLGDTGTFEATLEITSNDSLMMQRAVSVSGLIHDPQLTTGSILDFGSFPSGSGPQSTTIQLSNDGASQTLNISSIDVVGSQAANFGVTSFPASLDANTSGDIEVSFDPAGGEGTFLAQLQINSDDPVSPATIISMVARVEISNALVAWWPLDSDATDGSGNGFDGVVVDTVTFGQPGANLATAGSASFDGSGHIDVPWDPNLNGDGDFSVTLWANASAAGGGTFRSPITNRDDVAPGGAFRHGFIIYNTNGGNWSFWNGGGTGGDGGWNTMDVDPVITNQWLHLAITYDSALNEKKFYIDGVEAGTTNPAAYSPNNSTLGDGLTHEDEDLHIGGGGDTGTSFRWEGGIDDVGLFRTALTSEEIQQIKDGGIQSFLGGGVIFQITELTQAINGDVTLTFTSRPGVTYSIFRSIGTLGPFIELEDGVPGEEGTTQWTDISGASLLKEPRVFYRVNETR